MNSVVLKRKFTGKPATMPYSAAKLERMQRMFDESREKVLVARNEEIEKAYQKGKEDGISRTVSVLNKVVETQGKKKERKATTPVSNKGLRKDRTGRMLRTV